MRTECGFEPLIIINIIGPRWRNEDNDLLGCRARVGMLGFIVILYFAYTRIPSIFELLSLIIYLLMFETTGFA